MLLENGRQNHMQAILQHPDFPKVINPRFHWKRRFYFYQSSNVLVFCIYAMVSNGAHARASARVTQLFEEVSGRWDKNEKLFKILEGQRDTQAEGGCLIRTLVFVETKQEADFVAFVLIEKGIKAASINSDRPQDVRERFVKELRDGDLNVLVGTDVCQRYAPLFLLSYFSSFVLYYLVIVLSGLDIHGLDHVINYSIPNGSPEEALNKYIHRIGRTGRTHGGLATTFIDRCHTKIDVIKALVKTAIKTKQEIPVWLEELCGEHNDSEFIYATTSGFLSRMSIVCTRKENCRHKYSVSISDSEGSTTERNDSASKELGLPGFIYNSQNSSREMNKEERGNDSENDGECWCHICEVWSAHFMKFPVILLAKYVFSHQHTEVQCMLCSIEIFEI
ncbi:helicase protein [Dictyocaulus viviparus]|uniref:Helicase protein n=1 Tax=Dictyocaulus viviparus TaxID=29172 RepID=A0A0D8XLA1_DICVI|nr:helicase protein [Dictyocaulus viviparus]